MSSIPRPTSRTCPLGRLVLDDSFHWTLTTDQSLFRVFWSREYPRAACSKIENHKWTVVGLRLSASRTDTRVCSGLLECCTKWEDSRRATVDDHFIKCITTDCGICCCYGYLGRQHLFNDFSCTPCTNKIAAMWLLDLNNRRFRRFAMYYIEKCRVRNFINKSSCMINLQNLPLRR